MRFNRLLTISLAAALALSGCAAKTKKHEKPAAAKSARASEKESGEAKKAKDEGARKPEEIMTRGGFR